MQNVIAHIRMGNQEKNSVSKGCCCLFVCLFVNKVWILFELDTSLFDLFNSMKLFVCLFLVLECLDTSAQTSNHLGGRFVWINNYAEFVYNRICQTNKQTRLAPSFISW